MASFIRQSATCFREQRVRAVKRFRSGWISHTRDLPSLFPCACVCAIRYESDSRVWLSVWCCVEVTALCYAPDIDSKWSQVEQCRWRESRWCDRGEWSIRISFGEMYMSAAIIRSCVFVARDYCVMLFLLYGFTTRVLILSALIYYCTHTIENVGYN